MAAEYKQKRTIGATTNASGGGTAIGGALATILTWVLTMNGVEVDPIVVGAFGTIFSVAGAYVGGWLSPSKRGEANDFIAEAFSAIQAMNTQNQTIPTQNDVQTEVENVTALPESAEVLDTVETEPTSVRAEEPVVEEEEADSGVGEMTVTKL